MSEGAPAALNDALFARLLLDMMLPAELAAALQAQGDVGFFEGVRRGTS